MKKIYTLILALVVSCFAFNTFSQICDSRIFKPYTGPTNTQELSYLLFNSTKPALAKLDTATKNSLITYTIFFNGEPKGFSGSDTKIKDLVDSNIKDVLAAIVEMEVIVFDYENAPIIHTISFDDFVKNYTNDPIGWSFTNVYSECKNCYWNPPVGGPYCCKVGGPSCWDKICRITNGNYYIVE